MLYDDEEDRKKRLEEANRIIANNSFNNSEYDTRIQEANSIINSINPPKIKEITEAEQMESVNNANGFLGLIERNSQNKVIEEKEPETKKTEIEQQAIKEKQEDNVRQDINVEANPTVDTKNKLRETSQKFTTPNVKLASNEEVKNMTTVSNYDVMAQKEATKRNEQIEKRWSRNI